ncbi:CsbD family protein [Streptomyces sp. NPDC059819]|uniref:CsbD family protein n=1 Tax=Streptomyces sp. NPDC059819 TaxID=3346963 RepID=UPI003653E6EE
MASAAPFIDKEGTAMATTGKKMQSKAQEAAGKAKESAGKAMEKDDLRVKGAVEEREARVKQGAQRTKEAAAGKLKPKSGS